MHTLARQRARIVPPTPITVAVDDEETGICLCYGVVVNLSEAGACVWTNAAVPQGSRVRLRVSFAHPPEVHEMGGTVVWEGSVTDTAPTPVLGLRRFGVQWRDLSESCEARLRLVSSQRLAPTPASSLHAVGAVRAAR